MARSRTTFEKGHALGFQRGNRLGLRHGARVPSLVEAAMPEIRAKVEAELDRRAYQTPADESVVESYIYVTTQIELQRRYLDAHGGMFTTRGAPKKGAGFHLQLLDRQERLAKILGIGAAPNADVAQKMAGASLGAVEVRAALERLQRPKLAVINASQ